MAIKNIDTYPLLITNRLSFVKKINKTTSNFIVCSNISSKNNFTKY